MKLIHHKIDTVCEKFTFWKPAIDVAQFYKRKIYSINPRNY